MLKRLTEKRVKTFWGYDCNIEKMEAYRAGKLFSE